MAGSNAQDETITWQTGHCYLGEILVASTQSGVCAVLPGGSREELVMELARRFPNATLEHANNSRADWFAEVMRYLIDSRRPLAVQLDLRGTEFQCRVWRALQEIPSGSSSSYGEIAQRMGIPTASRAIAGACAANPLAVVVPCHRVLRGDGSLSGYRWGIKRKQALLSHEQGLSER
ncbi:MULTISPECIES: methylated-DNA--[protein]-cysteine S-methyltransferase [unclassified Marinobacter]|uniref:methylated-DNA--[protein]-cysteine S-methyltransferase n=1 Tax=unclassified Marinobacter TaxID=83889 RepID=UPI0026E49210|nr:MULTISPECIES: methylated-DNA--[protein]-cysteine S-methyltransferase [unclassified Marinobacter]MDO6440637.1 methylated-DNA--[protein]-cysteine S-methyltransferase [Marinobacter sp. 2_MG-2023]MDO6823465.1 methylated-DNA--[protein]-cysteine S-methyltransferase [Marinobacter sp. 1_MG-2023]